MLTVRSINMLKAIFFAFGARGAGLILQIVSLPMAAAALGNDGYALYSLFGVILSWLLLSNVGIGPSLTVAIAACQDKNNYHMRHLYFSNALLLMIFITAAVIIVASGTFFLTPASNFIYLKYGGYENQINLMFFLVLLMFSISTTLGCIEAVQLAYQQQHMMSLIVAVGTACAALLIFSIVKVGYVSALYILSAMYLPVMMARIVNANFFIRKNKGFFLKKINFDASVLKKIFYSGLYFSASGSLNNFLCHAFPILLAGIYLKASSAADLIAVINWIIIVASVFGLFLSPFLGGLPEAKAKQDFNWIKKSYLRLFIILISYALCVLMVVIFWGESIFSVWYQNTISPNSGLLISAGIYIVFLAIESVNYSFLSGLGFVSKCSIWLTAKSLVFAVFLLVLIFLEKSQYVFYGLIGTNLIFSTIPLTYLTFIVFRKKNEY